MHFYNVIVLGYYPPRKIFTYNFLVKNVMPHWAWFSSPIWCLILLLLFFAKSCNKGSKFENLTSIPLQQLFFSTHELPTCNICYRCYIRVEEVQPWLPCHYSLQSATTSITFHHSCFKPHLYPTCLPLISSLTIINNTKLLGVVSHQQLCIHFTNNITHSFHFNKTWGVQMENTSNNFDQKM
jgi:hypothetical protein